MTSNALSVAPAPPLQIVPQEQLLGDPMKHGV
jgi:hypothetical protein